MTKLVSDNFAGYIFLHKKIKEWRWYKDSKTVHLFIHVLLNANYADKPFEKTIIKRGQLVCSIGTLSQNTGLSSRSIRTALNKLKTTCEVTSETTSKYTLLTVVNYDLYQLELVKSPRRATSKTTNERQANDKPTTTTNKDKEDNKDKEEGKRLLKVDEFIKQELTKEGVVHEGKEIVNLIPDVFLKEWTKVYGLDMKNEMWGKYENFITYWAREDAKDAGLKKDWLRTWNNNITK